MLKCIEVHDYRFSALPIGSPIGLFFFRMSYFLTVYLILRYMIHDTQHDTFARIKQHGFFLLFQSHASAGKCGSHEYACKSSRDCIPAGKFCDTIEDCRDGSDEYDGCVDHVSESARIFCVLLTFILIYLFYLHYSSRIIILNSIFVATVGLRR